MKKRVIQVPMSYELLAELDAAAQQRGDSRSAFIREACTEYIASSREADLVRRYVEGYTKFPEGPEEEGWAEMGEKELAERLAADTW
jgi:metal-responsive CopG/Arc/MetJ family transcriptional regulator